VLNVAEKNIYNGRMKAKLI